MGFSFFFLADCQLGAYATFSGMTEADVRRFAERDMRVEIVPRVEGFAWDAARYRQAVVAINAARPSFVVVGGDMIDDPADAGQLDELLRITSAIDDDIPVHWAPGNHDIAFDYTVPTEDSLAFYRDAFGPDFYAFGYRNTRVVVLNTTIIDHPEHVGDQLELQYEFLEHELDRAAEVDHVILVGHHPLFTEYSGEPDTYWNLPRAQRVRLLSLIHRHGVRHAFAGHFHRNSIAYDGEFEMVTSGPVGYPLGEDPSGYRIVEVNPDVLAHRYQALDTPGTGGDGL